MKSLNLPWFSLKADALQARLMVQHHSKQSTAHLATAILKEAENGVPVPEHCREHGMSSANFYKWPSKYGGMDASMMARLMELDDENLRLKKMYAEEWLKAEIVQEALQKKVEKPSHRRRTASTSWKPAKKTISRVSSKAASNIDQPRLSSIPLH